MKAMEVGDRVAIRLSSVYYGSNADANPADVPGSVVRKIGTAYHVRWDNSGFVNTYARIDLKYWRGQVPKRAPKPEQKIKEELLAIAKEAKEACKKESQNVTARYAFIYNTGKVKVNSNAACHATVLSLDSAEKKSIAYITTCINRGREKDCDEEVAINYYDWLINRSPYADVFVTKDAREAYTKDKYVVCTASVPANMLQAALVATRQPWEYNNVCYVQKMMEERGVDGNTAHLIGCLLGRDTSGTMLTPSVQGGGHFHLDMHGMGKGGCRAFVENRPAHLTPAYDEGGGAHGVHRMFFENRDREFSLVKYIRHYLTEVGADEGKVETNPFAKAKKTESTSVHVDKLAKHVLTKGIFV
tara:strand:+ start:1987 stop:3063 length:1077 start_codon:yes stop_codon:yes gene_type:complete